MKKNITILIGIAAIIAVLYGGERLLDKDRQGGDVEIKNSDVVMRSFVGEVVRVFEGENKLEYGFDIPETATTSLDMDGALVKILDGETSLTSLYFSYEGGRGYSAIDYINNVIAPHVAVINPTGTSTIGGYDWQGAESVGSEWYIASVLNNKWLVVVESKKTGHDALEKLLTSITVK